MTVPNSTISMPILGIAQSEEFKCIGEDCTDTCCAGWGVSIDKFTFNKWLKTSNPDRFTKYLNIIPVVSENNLDKAEVILKSDGNCPFLEESKLCSIQKEHGHEFLSYVCRTFPRSNNSFFGIHEQNLSLACPEAARLILGSKTPLEISLNNNLAEELNVIKISAPLEHELANIESSIAWQLRALILQIIQKKKLP